MQFAINLHQLLSRLARVHGFLVGAWIQTSLPRLASMVEYSTMLLAVTQYFCGCETHTQPSLTPLRSPRWGSLDRRLLPTNPQSRLMTRELRPVICWNWPPWIWSIIKRRLKA